MQSMRFWFLTALLIGLSTTVRAAPDGGQVTKVIGSIVERIIVSGYDSTRTAARAQANAMQELCAQPTAATVSAARSSFSALVGAWSTVEWIRFGPARKDNRFERLMFWPDRRSRGLKQVQALADKPDTAKLTPTDLKQKSVALQGLLALEFVLFGKGSDAPLMTGSSRCAYGRTIAGAIEQTLAEIHGEWVVDKGYGWILSHGGPQNSIYRTRNEAVQEILRAASEHLQIARDLKIGASIGAGPARAKPKRAPFWRSNLTLMMIEGNIRSMERLFAETGFSTLLPTEKAWPMQSLGFELEQARLVIAELHQSQSPWAKLANEPRSHQRLAYSRIPLAGAVRIITETIPAALGLTLGFNSLNGD